MKKKFVIGNIVTLSIILIFDAWYMFGGGLFAKSIASIMFVVAGIVNYIYCTKSRVDLKFPKWMLVALTCAMLADIILVLNFYLGVVVFALGHVFYFISYCMLQKINRKDFVCGTGIFVFSFLVIQFVPILDFGSSFMKNICCVYALIISFMVGKSVSNLLKDKNETNIVIVVGSILFFISDFMLMLDKFASISGTSYLCLGTYYLGQFILAFSLFKYATINCKSSNNNHYYSKVS